jgi:hypothetical protein
MPFSRRKRQSDDILLKPLCPVEIIAAVEPMLRD